MKKIITLGIALCTIAVTNAQKIKGNGNIVTIERSTDDYDAIAVSGWLMGKREN